MLKAILWWFSGFAGGCFLGALIACPAKVISLLVTGVVAIVLGIIACKVKGKKTRKGKDLRQKVK